ncbi:MAG: hypothetical protein OEY49_03320 [Candidatus Heimdallarchaeota archaeon]|nr:hypothetical protein [Candidatus Heimdallarchaeota archaeon]
MTFVTQNAISTPGDSPSDPLVANFGLNNGYLDNSTDEEYFLFNDVGTYSFSINGPIGTDFDIEIYDINFVYITGAYSNDYPDTVYANSENGFIIVVYSFYSGYGSFSIEIGYGPDRMEYFDGFSVGDTFEWTLTENDAGTYSYDSHTVSIYNTPVIDYFGTEDDLFIVNPSTSSFITDKVGLVILPKTIYYTDGSSISQFHDIFFEFVAPANDFSSTATSCGNSNCEFFGTTFQGEELQLIYDQTTFVLTYYYSSYNNGTHLREIEVVLETDLGVYSSLSVTLYYYTGFQQGDFYEWDVVAVDNTGPDTSITGVRVDILVGSPVNTPTIQEDLFRMTFTGSSGGSSVVEIPSLFILPTRVTEENGTSYTFAEIVQLYLDNLVFDIQGGSSVVCNTSNCTYSLSFDNQEGNLDLELNYDITTGLLLSYTFRYDDYVYDEWTEVSVVLITPLPGNSNSTNNDSSSDASPFNLPVNITGLFFFLIAIPVLKIIKKEKN